MTQIGETFTTGQTAPVSGTYEFVRHIGPTSCTPTAEERQIPLSRGETFPPHRSCNKGVVWQLIRYA
jgi:hypothetical protein